MSAIDTYKHQCIGIITCPSSYEIVFRNNSHRDIPLYRLDEDAPEWHAKKGDLLLGGGSGESAALRISLPEAMHVLTRFTGNDIYAQGELFRAYWSMTEAFVFCDGYVKLGWQPSLPIELWLARQALSFILREYPDQYREHAGPLSLEQDGSICRPPRPDREESRR